VPPDVGRRLAARRLFGTDESRRHVGDAIDGIVVEDVVVLDKQTGRFSTDELTPGRYRVRLHASIGDDNQRVDYVCDDIIVPPTGLKDVVLRPLHEKESSRRAK
jgi:hypothetical protein